MTIKDFITSSTPVKSYLMLFILALFMLGANPFKSETIAPMDLLVQYPGWQNTGIKVPYINGERSDVLDAKLPIWISAKRSLYKGEIPIWNHQRAGKPSLTFTNSLLTPAFVTFALFENDALGFYLSNLVNVLIGLLGMFLFLRLFLGQTASMFGAFIFMFSGFNAAWFFWAHVDTSIWTPWVLFSVYSYIHTKEKKYLPLVALSMLMLNLGGFPMVAVMTYMAVAIMTILFLLTNKSSFKEWLSTTMYLTLFAVLAVLIALPFIYPLVELLEWMGGIGYRKGGAGFKAHEYQLFFDPDLYRSPKVEMTFYVGILPLFFLLFALFISFFKPKFIGIFGLVLFLYAITIAFTLISPELIHKIPTLNSSLLTRFGYLIGLALAITSAFVFHEVFERFKHTRWVLPLMLIFFSLQVADQRKLFHAFNDAVPNNSFYPKTKSITYLQDNLQPLQHVMADSGYLIAGTLGGYGLNDWFAHSFHTGAEKEVLSKIVHKPFKTPTSAMFNFSQINLESPYIDYLGIKSILSTSFSTDKHVSLWNNERKQQPCPNLPQNTLVQRFHIDTSTKANGIALKMATYSQPHASSDVQLILRKSDTVLADIVVDKSKIIDNTWISFKFNSMMTLTEGDYSVSIAMLDTTDAKPLTIWSNVGEKKHKLLVNGKENPLSLKMVLTQEKYLDKKYKVLNLEPNIYIIENLHVHEGAYFLPALDTKHSVDYTHIITTLPSNTQIKITYNSNKKGWIVLPMRSYPGWVATVNSKIMPIKTFLGMLPAINVNGKSTILLTYSPSYNTTMYLLSLLGLFIVLFTMIKFRKKD